MDLLVIIMIGLGIGAVVELLLPRHNLSELVLAMLLGIAGALGSGYCGQWAGFYWKGEPIAYLVSVVGAIVTLVTYGVFFRKRRV